MSKETPSVESHVADDLPVAGANPTSADGADGGADSGVSTADLEAIRREVGALVADETTKLEAAKGPPKKPEKIRHPFVMDCCRAMDKGMGVLFATMMRGKYVYVPEKKQWYSWHAHYWQEELEHTVRAAAERVAERLTEAQSIEKDELKSIEPDDKEARGYHIKNLRSLTVRINALHEPRGVTSCLRFSLENDDPLLVKSEKMDSLPMHLACENGVVDMRTGELSQGRPQDYITRLCPHSWKGVDTPAPKWERMIYEIFGENQAVTDYFQKLLGYALAGRVTEKLFIILLGEEGDSGKTTIFETLYEIIRDYAAPMPVELLLEQGGAARDPNSPTPVIMALRGLRLTWASEPGERRRFSIDRIKLMSGNDSLSGRQPYDIVPTKFLPTHTLFLLSNHKLQAPSHDQAFWSRVRLLECPFSFVANPIRSNQRQRNVTLKDEIISEEASGVLAWVVRGYQRYLLEGLDPPSEVIAATSQYQNEEDFIVEFIDACILEAGKVDDTAWESMADVYEVYRNWYLHCHGKHGLLSQIKFGKLAGRKLRKEKIGGQMRFYDIRILAEAKDRYLKS
jgi:putative DNA primase/helicase